MGKIISEPDKKPAVQASIVLPEGINPRTLNVFPPCSDDIQALWDIVNRPELGLFLGVDVEFREDDSITIVAIANSNRIYAAAWTPEVASEIKKVFTERKHRWVAHSGVSADKPIIEKALGIQTDLSVWEDSMLTHYLSNQELVKAPDKDDAEGDGALGFMDLWTSTSIVEDVWNWKFCREAACQLFGPEPCPEHEPVLYCGVDAWAGLQVFLKNKKRLEIVSTL